MNSFDDRFIEESVQKRKLKGYLHFFITEHHSLLCNKSQKTKRESRGEGKDESNNSQMRVIAKFHTMSHQGCGF